MAVYLKENDGAISKIEIKINRVNGRQRTIVNEHQITDIANDHVTYVPISNFSFLFSLVISLEIDSHKIVLALSNFDHLILYN